MHVERRNAVKFLCVLFLVLCSVFPSAFDPFDSQGLPVRAVTTISPVSPIQPERQDAIKSVNREVGKQITPNKNKPMKHMRLNNLSFQL